MMQNHQKESKMSKVTDVIVVFMVVWGVFVMALALTQHIGMTNQTNEYHEFGYWHSGWDKFLGEPPVKTVKIPLTSLPDGTKNYINNPNPSEFNSWIGYAVVNPKAFTLEGYQKATGAPSDSEGIPTP